MWQPADPEVARVLDRVVALETEVAQWETRAEAQRNEFKTRRWQVALAFLTCIVGPLLLLGIVAVIHLLSR